MEACDGANSLLSEQNWMKEVMSPSLSIPAASAHHSPSPLYARAIAEVLHCFLQCPPTRFISRAKLHANVHGRVEYGTPRDRLRSL